MYKMSVWYYANDLNSFELRTLQNKADLLMVLMATIVILILSKKNLTVPDLDKIVSAQQH